ncbi:integrase [Escherichia coli]|nr:integrase [Escherichia coli]
MNNAILNDDLIAVQAGNIVVYNYDGETREYISESTEYLAVGVGIPANSIKGEHVISGKVIFMETKNGKRRVIPISSELECMIKTKATGRLIYPSYAAVRAAIRKVRPDLPEGQSIHVLRHTFATHFMINGGNIITLQRILGHSTIQQTMTYAHFAPDYLQDAVRFNPVAELSRYCP